MDNAGSIRKRYDEVSPTYEGKEPEDASIRLYWSVYEHLTRRALERVLPKDGRSLSILDAGGGTGKYGAWLAERGHRLTVLDLSPGMLDQAKERFGAKGLAAEFVVGDVASLDFPDNSFDLVFSEGDPVSYCLDRYPEAIRELVRVARGGAPVVLGVDNRYAHFIVTLRGDAADKALSILQTGRSLCPYKLPVHTFLLSELEAAILAAGAELVEVFGKPVLFFEILRAFEAERGADFDPWQAQSEIFALQERLAHGGFAAMGGHLQVMARKK